jgi:CheY-like chemotaxis protein
VEDVGMPEDPLLRPFSLQWLLASWSRLSRRGRAFRTPAPSDTGDVGDAPAHPALPLRLAARVLLVDDNMVHRLLASEMLRACGAQPHLATDGAEAVAAACTQRFDLILMDLQMPILDGLEATKAIRRFEQANAKPRTPVVAYTSSAMHDMESIVHDCGIDAVLEKPCAIEGLRACLDRWCVPAGSHTRDGPPASLAS